MAIYCKTWHRCGSTYHGGTSRRSPFFSTPTASWWPLNWRKTHHRPLFQRFSIWRSHDACGRRIQLGVLIWLAEHRPGNVPHSKMPFFATLNYGKTPMSLTFDNLESVLWCTSNRPPSIPPSILPEILLSKFRTPVQENEVPYKKNLSWPSLVTVP